MGSLLKAMLDSDRIAAWIRKCGGNNSLRSASKTIGMLQSILDVEDETVTIPFPPLRWAMRSENGVNFQCQKLSVNFHPKAYIETLGLAAVDVNWDLAKAYGKPYRPASWTKSLGVAQLPGPGANILKACLSASRTEGQTAPALTTTKQK